MSDETITIPGIVGEVPNDPRILEALKKHQEKNEEGISETFTQPPAPDLSGYGIELRVPGLGYSSIIHRIIAAIGNPPESYQWIIWVYSLGAPLKDVYTALDGIEKEGISKFMAAAHTWLDEKNIPMSLASEVGNMVAKQFELAQKLMPTEVKAGEGMQQDLKKNHLRGLQEPPTS